MNGVHYLGKQVASLELYDETSPVTGVALIVDAENEYLAGDDSGYMMEIECPYGTQEMADEMLASILGRTYKGYRATAAELDPTAELGDVIVVNGTTSVLLDRVVNFGPGHMSEISAPGENELVHEYGYTSPTKRETDRKIAITRSMITKTSEEISLRVEGLEGEYTELKTTLGGVTVTDDDGTTWIDGAGIKTGTLSVGQINMSGAITWDHLSSDVQSTINASSGLSETEVEEIASTVITDTLVASPNIKGATITGSEIYGSQFYGEDFSIVADEGAFNIWGTYEGETYHFFELSYAQHDVYPEICFDSPANGTAYWQFVSTYFMGKIVRFMGYTHFENEVFFDNGVAVDFTYANVTGLTATFG